MKVIHKTRRKEKKQAILTKWSLTVHSVLFCFHPCSIWDRCLIYLASKLLWAIPLIVFSIRVNKDRDGYDGHSYMPAAEGRLPCIHTNYNRVLQFGLIYSNNEKKPNWIAVPERILSFEPLCTACNEVVTMWPNEKELHEGRRHQQPSLLTGPLLETI